MLHSISRVVDRMIQQEKDIERLEFDLRNMKEDNKKTRGAVESFFNDFLKEEREFVRGKGGNDEGNIG